ncbi:hypothetical protein Tco_0912824 [Tanacetum coccineum]
MLNKVTPPDTYSVQAPSGGVTVAKLGQMAYTLKLPPNATKHPTFHVSLLKKHCGEVLPSPDLTISHTTSDTRSQIAVLEVKTSKKHNKVHIDWLVQRSDGTPMDATWEATEDMVASYPSFDPWDQRSA